MRGARSIILIATVFAVCACSSGHHPGSSASRPPSRQASIVSTDHSATRAWVAAVAPDTKRLRDQLANLQYAWNGAQSGGSQARTYAPQLDLVALNNVQPAAA